MIRSTLLLCAFVSLSPAQDWMTAGSDAQRSGWMRGDVKISKERLSKPGFALVWKIKLPNQPRQLDGLSAPVLLDRYIGYRGFRTFAFMGGSSGSVFTIDTDLARLEWQKKLEGEPAARGVSAQCPGGLTAGVTRPVNAAFPVAGGGGGFGRSGPAASDVGQPLEGAVTIAQVSAAAAAASAVPRRPPLGFNRGPALLYTVAADGTLHGMYVSNGEEPEAPTNFLPANASVHGLVVIDKVAYAATEGGCFDAPNGLWALDLATKSVANWKADVKGFAFGADGTVYATAGDGPLSALSAKTLAVKASSEAKGDFASSPLLFEFRDKTLLAAVNKQGAVELFDAAALKDRLAESPGVGISGELASWQDAAGTRWIVAPTADSVVALKLVEDHGALTLKKGWTAPKIQAPLTPAIVNGVIFVAAGGSAKQHAVLYALDGEMGRPLWNSGDTITSFVPHSGGLAAGGGQIYVGAYDGTLYAFGFPIEH